MVGVAAAALAALSQATLLFCDFTAAASSLTTADGPGMGRVAAAALTALALACLFFCDSTAAAASLTTADGPGLVGVAAAALAALSLAGLFLTLLLDVSWSATASLAACFFAFIDIPSSVFQKTLLNNCFGCGPNPCELLY